VLSGGVTSLGTVWAFGSGVVAVERYVATRADLEDGSGRRSTVSK